MWAKAQARATTKPLAQVTVTVADASYGPIASDAKGGVVVPILVPPGTPTALVSSVDVLGNKTDKPLPLDVPGFARLSLVPLDEPVAADDRSVGRVLIGVVDAVGAPLASVELTAATTVGGHSTSVTLSVAGHRASGWLVGPGLGRWSSVGDVVAIGPEVSMLTPLPVLDGRLHAGLTLGVHEGIAVASNAPFSSWRSWPL